MTLGARVAVIDTDGRFLLVRHTYTPGWILPGGGVERGESCLAAATREIWEEGAIRATGPFALHGVFSNHADFPGDHLVVYVLRAFEQHEFKPNMEIADARFFAADDLPVATTAGSRRRIAEIVAGKPPADLW
jgi:8-oxo-dGTP pyrophosphatase MutT (NUDIX family)